MFHRVCAFTTRNVSQSDRTYFLFLWFPLLMSTTLKMSVIQSVGQWVVSRSVGHSVCQSVGLTLGWIFGLSGCLSVCQSVGYLGGRSVSKSVSQSDLVIFWAILQSQATLSCPAATSCPWNLSWPNCILSNSKKAADHQRDKNLIDKVCNNLFLVHLQQVL